MGPWDELKDLGTAAVSDALDRLGIEGCVLGIGPVHRGLAFAGPARTVRYAPVAPMPGTVGDFIDGIEPGQVVVLDNGGRMDATVWGDIMTEFSHRRGIAATVIDGVCRDTDLAGSLGYPLFSRGRYMRTGKDRVQVEALDEPVGLAGIRVEPRDILVGDSDGLLVVPAQRALEVLDVAREIETVEERIREAVRTGSTLAAARAAMGYHSLQTRQA